MVLTKFDAMFSMHTAVMLLIEPGSGKIIDANPAAVRFYGYSLDELKSMQIGEINMLPKEQVVAYRALAVQKEEQHFLFPHRLKDGTIKHVDVYSSPIDLDGKTVLYSIIFDVTEREWNREALYKEKELLDITLESIGDGVVTTDETGIITRINKAALTVLGWELHEVIGKKFGDALKMQNENNGEPVPSIVETVLRTGNIQELANHTELICKNGMRIPIEDSAAPILDEKGKLHGVVVVFRDVSLAREKKKRIEFLSYHDSLTGLYNRGFYQKEENRFLEPSMHPMAVIMGDMNGLKLTNDVFGHENGDKLLIMVSDVIKRNMKPDMIAIRWGGDEFVILLPHTNGRSAERFIHHIKKELSVLKVNDIIDVSISFGYAIKKEHGESLEAVLKEAEEMMYRAKLLESKSMRGSMINALMATLNEKSAETKDHTLRLTRHCLQIGEILDLDDEIKSELSLLSVLHDIGKIGVPEHILMKPGSLSTEEWAEMRSHPEIGYRIASNVPELVTVAKEILHHHEKWDGSGYPSGLKGEQIPINCRILAVVDSFDAMTNNRIYRKAMGQEEAIQELIKNKGTQFDPRIVDIFIKQCL